MPALIKALESYGREDIDVVAGGVIPKKDYETLYQMGVKHVFGPGTVIARAAADILKGYVNELRAAS